MQLPRNHFKQALRGGQVQIGLWHGLLHPYLGELLAGAGFDWICIDTEHSPNDPRSVLTQLQAMAPYPVQPLVRTLNDDAALLKQYLDIGAQSLLIPMIDTPEQAARVVAATRYPPRGIRGVGTALARASRWNRIPDYVHRCEEELCVLVQVETITGLGNLAAIAATEGVDGVLFGPSDLAASFGLLGRPDDPRVQQAIGDGIEIVRSAGKAAGVLAVDPALVRKYLGVGALFVAVGLDGSLMVRAATDLAAQYKDLR